MDIGHSNPLLNSGEYEVKVENGAFNIQRVYDNLDGKLYDQTYLSRLEIWNWYKNREIMGTLQSIVYRKDQENRMIQKIEYGEDQESWATQQLLKINIIYIYDGDIPMSQ